MIMYKYNVGNTADFLCGIGFTEKKSLKIAHKISILAKDLAGAGIAVLPIQDALVAEIQLNKREEKNEFMA